MRALIKVLLVLLICLVGIGFYRGWFSLSSRNSDAKDNKVNVKLSVDEAKMKADVKKAKEKVKEEIREIEGKVKAKEAAK